LTNIAYIQTDIQTDIQTERFPSFTKLLQDEERKLVRSLEIYSVSGKKRSKCFCNISNKSPRFWRNLVCCFL